MATVPNKRVERVQFYESHIAPFTTNAVAIGLSTTEVADLNTKTTAARTAYNEQQAALQASKAATEKFHNAVTVMSIAGEAAIARIRGQANLTNNPNVYTLAEIPGPVTPTPSGPPGTPFDFKVTLGNDGTLNMKWKNKNATGAVYMIYRRLGAAGPWESLGGVGSKKYADATIPAGTSQVSYQVQAVRSTGVSDWALAVVNFGHSGIGQSPVSVTESTTTTRLAA